MDSLFFYGSLRHRPLLELVLGRPGDAQIVPATLPGHAVYQARGQAFPLIVEEPGAVAQGLHVSGLSDEDVARLDFYEGGFDFALRPVTVETAEGPRGALVYFPEQGRWQAGMPWSLADWQRDWAAISLRAAEEAMGQFGRMSAAELARWLPQIRVRAASWVTAQGQPRPMVRRAGFTDADVERGTLERPYCKFFALVEEKLRFRRFDGSMSAPVARAAFVSGDAVTVLPYDPRRDRVMVIEQFRYGPLARGDRQPWSLEPIAGRIDPGEAPEACARREAQEEAGLTFDRLEAIASYYPTPGGVSEYLTSYLGIADLPDGVTGTGGVAGEAEDIRSLLLTYAELQDLLASGEAENGPLILSALWLAAHRDRLRGDA